MNESLNRCTHSHISVLVLPVRLAVVANDPVGIGRRRTLGVGRGNLSVQGVVHPLEKTVTQVHVTNRVDSLREVYRPGHLSVVVRPVVLDAFHVPLVDHDDNFLGRVLINGCEQLIVALVNEDLL